MVDPAVVATSAVNDGTRPSATRPPRTTRSKPRHHLA
jgi:hypothetical protein